MAGGRPGERFTFLRFAAYSHEALGVGAVFVSIEIPVEFYGDGSCALQAIAEFLTEINGVDILFLADFTYPVITLITGNPLQASRWRVHVHRFNPIVPLVPVAGVGWAERGQWRSRHAWRRNAWFGRGLIRRMEAEEGMSSRLWTVVCVLLGVLVFGWVAGRKFSSRQEVADAPKVTIQKQPAAFANHTFDPAAPPADMPPLAAQESAECDSSFLSGASVRGEFRRADATRATVMITQIKVTLQLHINIWVPIGASQQVMDHEDGHREISEYYYQSADKLAERIAAAYMEKRAEISGTDLDAESTKMLQQMATEITDEYNRQLNPEPTQLFYDSITDHGRNGTVAKDAVEHALKNVTIEVAQPTTSTSN
jgi:hypothetical protein